MHINRWALGEGPWLPEIALFSPILSEVRIKWGKPSGIDLPKDPPSDADAFDTVLFYLRHYEAEFGRARRVVKRRASSALIAAGVGNTFVVVIGGVVTAWSALSWLGIVSSGLAASVAAVLAWDNHFQHEALWVQRSLVLQKLHEIRRNAEVASKSVMAPRQDIAESTLAEMNVVLRQDIESWSDIRHRARRPRTDIEGTATSQSTADV